jgi:hypothetical protein
VEWYLVLALLLGVSLIMLPVIFVLFLNIGGIYQMMRTAEIKGSLLRRRSKVVISIMLAPFTLLVAIPVLLAILCVSLPMILIFIPVVMTISMSHSLLKLASRRFRMRRARAA